MAYFIPAPTQFSAIPYYGTAPGVSGYRMSVTGNTTFTVAPGYARSMINDWAIVFPSGQPNEPALLTVDISTVGLNGCYPVSIPSLGLTANTVFPVYVLSNSSGGDNQETAVVVATNNNFLPATYDSFRRIGWAFVAYSTSYLIPFVQSGHDTERQYLFQDPVVAVSSGSAVVGSPGLLDLTSTVGLIPPGRNVSVQLMIEIAPDAADGYCVVEPGSLTSSTPPVQVFGSVAAHKNSAIANVIATPNASTGDANIKYFVDNGSSVANINVCGFIDSLSNALT